MKKKTEEITGAETPKPVCDVCGTPYRDAETPDCNGGYGCNPNWIRTEEDA